MKVFLSWSGEMSHQVASALRDWLPYVIQSVRPFISSGDINKGARWSDMLAHELNDTQYGIICITPYNINAAWLNFEAGALSKIIDRSCVMPFLFHVDRSAVRGPLSQFQATIYEKEDIFDLLTSINNRFAPEERLEHEILSRELDVWWKKLREALDAIPDIPGDNGPESHAWLITPEKLLKAEADERVKSVWVITPEIYHHALDPKVRDVVLMNIGRGVTYRYIIPKSAFADAVKDELRHISEDPNKLAVKPIPDEEFRSQAVTDYILINPEHDDHYHLQVYLQLPVNPRGTWILVDDEAAIGFTNRFCKMWNREEITKT